MRYPLILLINCLLIPNIGFTDNIIDNPELLYKIPANTNEVLAQKVTINWKFHNFKEFTQSLQQTYGINSKVTSFAAPPSTAIWLNLENDTIEHLLNQASSRFGYKWSYQDNMVVFAALTPLPSSKAASKQPSLDKLISPDILITKPSWSLAVKDRTLRNTISKWCKRSGWQLVWNVKADYPITNNWNFNGSFEEVINEVLKASSETDMPLFATMHDSNKVLEIYSPVDNK